MKKFKSIQTAINPQTNKSVPLWLLDTITNTVIHYDTDTHKENPLTFFTTFFNYKKMRILRHFRANW